MRRTMIIGAIGATTLTIGLWVGATLAANDPIPPTPTPSITMPEDMTSMMDGNGMTMMMGENGMMDGTGMEAMHTAMHQALEGKVPADVLAACDEVHTSMSGASAPSSTDPATNHAAYHPGGQP